MTGLEIALFILGAAFIIISFFIVDNGNGSGRNTGPSETSITGEVLRRIGADTIEDLNHKSDLLIAESEDKLEAISNDKIIAVGEYSDQILEKINSNHKEVVFLYQMLNDKEDELKATASKIENVRIECEKLIKLKEAQDALQQNNAEQARRTISRAEAEAVGAAAVTGSETGRTKAIAGYEAEEAEIAENAAVRSTAGATGRTTAGAAGRTVGRNGSAGVDDLTTESAGVAGRSGAGTTGRAATGTAGRAGSAGVDDLTTGSAGTAGRAGAGTAGRTAETAGRSASTGADDLTTGSAGTAGRTGAGTAGRAASTGADDLTTGSAGTAGRTAAAGTTGRTATGTATGRTAAGTGGTTSATGRRSTATGASNTAKSTVRKTPAQPAVTAPIEAEGRDNRSLSRNEEVIALHRQGRSIMEISKLLGMGQGEVRLIINLYG